MPWLPRSQSPIDVDGNALPVNNRQQTVHEMFVSIFKDFPRKSFFLKIFGKKEIALKNSLKFVVLQMIMLT